MAAPGDKDIGRLDVAMDDTLAVRGVKRVGGLDGERQQGFRGAVVNPLMVQRR
jgi:hypothetical protein